MFRVSLPAAAIVLGALVSSAPAQIRVFGGPGERASSTVVFFTDKPMGLACVQYGQPEWQDSHEAQLDQLKGKDVRLGKDNWTTLNTDVDLTISGVKVPAGIYFLGLHCDDEGAFSLLAFDAAKATKAGAVPFAPATWGKAEISIPLEHGKTESVQKKMLIELSADADAPTDLTFRIAWGKHEATATGKFHLEKAAANAAGHKTGK